MSNQTGIAGLFIVTALMFMVIAITSESPTIEDVKDIVYCENVSIWEYDGVKGVEPKQRSGHPNYKSIDCDSILGENKKN